MEDEMIVARFRNREAAEQARAELQQAGFDAAAIGLRADAEGGAVLSLHPGPGGAAGTADAVLRRHGAEAIERRPGDEPPSEAQPGRTTTLSGAPADYDISPGTVPQAEPDTDWLIRREGELAADVDLDRNPDRRR